MDECAWVNTAASVGEYEEASRPRTLNAAEKKYPLANLYGANRISSISMRIRTSDRSQSKIVEAADVTMMVGSFDAVYFAGCCRRDS